MILHDWDIMEPILGMRFENNEQLKLSLANYGGTQWVSTLVYEK